MRAEETRRWRGACIVELAVRQESTVRELRAMEMEVHAGSHEEMRVESGLQGLVVTGRSSDKL